MLEAQELWLAPWSAEPSRLAGDGVKSRMICNVEGRALGCARCAQPASRTWWPLPGGAHLDIFETEDESLLCTVQRRFGLPPWWEVVDADRQPVGMLQERSFRLSQPQAEIWELRDDCGRWRLEFQGLVLYDRFSRNLAILDFPSTADTGRLVAPSGDVLATLARVDSELALRFAPRLTDEPFVKMLVLAAVLTDRE
jgi:hypothetical protein